MSDHSAIVSISRKKTSANILRQFSISIDGSTVGKIKSGQTKQFKIPSGVHNIQVKLDLYKSKELPLEIQPNEMLVLSCGDRSPETFSEAFTLNGLTKSMNSLFKPSQYLYVELVSRTLGHEPNTPQAEFGTGYTRSNHKHLNTQTRTIFISYRRDDSREITGRICDRLNDKFGKETIFRDVDSIPAGVDFRDHIEKTIDRCSALVAIIGNTWLKAKNSKGERRLGLADDPLSLEIEAALNKNIPVIPVLVKGATMPDPDELPEPIRPLAYRNAIIIPVEPYFHAGVDRLIDELEKPGSPSDIDITINRNYCLSCGGEITPNNKFCIQCGKPV